uniref:Uncharacterized protein n=1 Tax=Arundo donax TaxID=35708 RepID=A0A0A8Y9J7_ARUDO
MCKLEVTVSSYFHIHDGIKEYCKEKMIDFDVDSEEYSIIDTEKEISKEYSYGSDYEVNFWYDGKDGQSVRLATDAEFLGLKRASRKMKFFMTVDRCVH